MVAVDDAVAEEAQLPAETGGARVMLHLAALAIGLYRALLARVDEALADAEQTADSGDALEFARANRTLHELIEAPAPAALREMIDDAWERVWQARRRMSLFSLVPGIAIEAQRDHVELVDAVRRRDAAAASAAMERHRESTLESWRSALGELT